MPVIEGGMKPLEAASLVFRGHLFLLTSHLICHMPWFLQMISNTCQQQTCKTVHCYSQQIFHDVMVDHFGYFTNNF